MWTGTPDFTLVSCHVMIDDSAISLCSDGDDKIQSTKPFKFCSYKYVTHMKHE